MNGLESILMAWDYPDHIDQLAVDYGIDVYDHEVIEEAYNTGFGLSNSYVNLVFMKLETSIVNQLEEENIPYEDAEIEYFINCIDSHFSIFGEEVYDKNDIEHAINKYKKELTN